MLKKLSLFVLTLLSGVTLLASEYSGGVKGTVVNRADKSPLQGVKLELLDGQNLLAEGKTGADGNFMIPNLADGMYTLVVTSPEFVQTSINVTVNDGYVKNMFKISLTPLRNLVDYDDALLDGRDFEDSGYSDSPTYIFGSNDPFISASSFNFSTVRFRTRGYTNDTQDLYFAGIRINDSYTGMGSYSLWSGLTEGTRNKDTVNGLEDSSCGFGGFNGLTNINASASALRTGFRTSVLTNSATYRLRVNMSYGSGLLDNGWSYGFNISSRLGGNDWVNGVYYRSLSYYLAAEKAFNDVHRLGFIFLAAPVERGKQNCSTQEVYDLVGDNMYNSNWGWQDGKMRNSRVSRTHEPIAVIQYKFTPSAKLGVDVTALYRFGKNGSTALDWYDSYSPNPDYYRNLPSYFWNADPDYQLDEKQKWYWAREAWTSGYEDVVHMNWDRIYSVNSNNVGADGKSRSKYVQAERHVDQKDFNLAVTGHWKPVDGLTVNGGLNGKINRTEYYNKIADLLGGDYFLDIDNFADRDFASSQAKVQNDLDYFLDHKMTTRVLTKGSKYNYDYYAHMHQIEGWMNASYVRGDFSAGIAGRVGHEEFWREGLMRKGLFAGLDENGNHFVVDGVDLTTTDSYGNVITSYGDSRHLNFNTYAVKGSVGYVIGGKLKISAGAGYFNDAPAFNKVFLSPRTRNTIVADLDRTKTFASDVNLQYSNKGYSFRLTGYYTKIDDKTDVMSFYDDSQNAFTNFAMSNIDTRHAGIEFGFRVPTPIPSLTLEGALAWGEYIYTSTPYMTQTVDNSAETLIEHKQVPYWKSNPVFKRDSEGNITSEVDHYQKHYVPSTPQLATTVGLDYNIRNWYIELNGQYFAHSYLDMNPVYRTDMATAGTDGQITPREVEYITKQEEFDPCFLLNASVGKTKYIGQNMLGFSLSVRNILNTRNIRTGGYEQTRLIDGTLSNDYKRFDSKYFYLSGINYMLNVYFKF